MPDSRRATEGTWGTIARAHPHATRNRVDPTVVRLP